MGEWIETCCDLTDPDARHEATPLYQAFRQFCIDRGDKEDRILSQTTFGLRLNDAQIYSVANHATGKKDRVGIKLKSAGSGGVAGGVGGSAADDWLSGGGDAASDFDGF
jgi:hypothetical protein